MALSAVFRTSICFSDPELASPLRQRWPCHKKCDTSKSNANHEHLARSTTRFGPRPLCRAAPGALDGRAASMARVDDHPSRRGNGESGGGWRPASWTPVFRDTAIRRRFVISWSDARSKRSMKVTRVRCQHSVQWRMVVREVMSGISERVGCVRRSRVISRSVSSRIQHFHCRRVRWSSSLNLLFYASF